MLAVARSEDLELVDERAGAPDGEEQGALLLDRHREGRQRDEVGGDVLSEPLGRRRRLGRRRDDPERRMDGDEDAFSSRRLAVGGRRRREALALPQLALTVVEEARQRVERRRERVEPVEDDEAAGPGALHERRLLPRRDAAGTADDSAHPELAPAELLVEVE